MTYRGRHDAGSSRLRVGGMLFGFAVLVLIAGFGTGVVREHCIDSARSNATGEVQVDSRWTYVVWPPLAFAGTDPPPGNCVRNQPGTAALQYIGVRDLGGPREQVRKRLREELGR